MSDPFDPRQGPIVVKAEVTGPAQTLTVQLLLDTGATTSVLSVDTLLLLGYDFASETDRVLMTTGSAMTMVPRVVLTRLTALGRHRIGFPVLAHTLPVTASIHGLLGLDFLRDGILTLNFRTGRISLA